VSLRAKTLARAALVVGGVEALAERLGVTSKVLSLLIRGGAPVPPELFFQASEIITEAGIADISKRSRINEAKKPKQE
jgi:DNA-binding transcriptional regulator YdaS (Cro superfamily)